MENVEELYKTALNDFFNLLSRNEAYLKTRHMINYTTGNIDPEILEKFEKLHNHFETEYKTFNEAHSKLIEYLKTTPTKSVTLNVKTGSAQKGNYQIELDSSNNLTVKRHP